MLAGVFHINLLPSIKNIYFYYEIMGVLCTFCNYLTLLGNAIKYPFDFIFFFFRRAASFFFFFLSVDGSSYSELDSNSTKGYLAFICMQVSIAELFLLSMGISISKKLPCFRAIIGPLKGPIVF